MTRPDLETQMALLDRVEPVLADPHVAFLQAHYQDQLDRPLAPQQIAQALNETAGPAASAPPAPSRSGRRTMLAAVILAVVGGSISGPLLIAAAKKDPVAAISVPSAPMGPVYRAYGPVVGAHQVAEATCPTHTVLTGGGYVMSGYAGGANGPEDSYPQGSGWAVASGEVASGTQFQPYALCAPGG